jgi:hypothetical protein
MGRDLIRSARGYACPKSEAISRRMALPLIGKMTVFNTLMLAPPDVARKITVPTSTGCS